MDSTAWDYGSVSSSASQYYFLELIEPVTLTIALTWNAQVSPGGVGGDNFDATSLVLPNLTLSLYEATGYSLDGLVASSISTVDNVEFLTLSLVGGRYAIEVSTGYVPASNYALAWEAQVIPEPGTVTLMVLGWVVLVLGRQHFQSKSSCLRIGFKPRNS
ncbi:MAG: hypothetical protein HC904_14310 [Blastochloris sp.]|nr:hypothetical protein [Blastochloris sp.]